MLPAFAFSMISCGGSGSDKSSVVFVAKCDSTASLIPDFYGDSVYALATYSIMWPEKVGANEISALHDSIIAFGIQPVWRSGVP